jgi:hypothetical protein
VSIVREMGTLLSFASGGSVRRGWLESCPTRTGTALLVVCLSLGWCREARVWCVPFTLVRGSSLCLEVSHHIKKVVGVLGLGVVSLLDVPLLVANTSMGGTIAALGPRGATYHGLPFVVRVVHQGDVWVFHLGEIGWILLTPRSSKWRGTGLIRFVLTPVLSLLLTLALVFDSTGGRHGGLLVDRLWLLSTHDRRSTVVLQPHRIMTKEYITFGDNGKGRVLSVSTVKVSQYVTLRCVSLVKSLGYNLLSVSQLLDEGFEVRFKTSCSRVLDSRGNLVCTIVPEGQIFKADFSQCVGSSRCSIDGVTAELWKWHRRLGHLSFDLLSRLSGLGLV